MIRVERAEGLIRLTAAKGLPALPPLLMDDAGLSAWIGRRPRPPWNLP